MELEPGCFVTPTVRLVELLGAGGMGSVWIADHLALETRVAVKFVSAELVKKNAAVLERFNREASLSAKIKSPYVVQIFDHGVMNDGRPYIVMELLEGSSLEHELSRRRLSTSEAANVVSQVAKGLSKAHKLGIVHRDIKPDNLFLTYEDDELFLKVLDFGIAKQTGVAAASSVTSTGVMVGTPEYMSPEQVLSAKDVDFRADLWGLAVVAYHCLTGGVPFTGETLGSLCVSIANGTFEPPSKLRAGLPPTVDAWFERGLAKDPHDRFSSARELAKTFAAALAGHSLASGEMSGDWSGAHSLVSLSSESARPPLASDASALELARASASSVSAITAASRPGSDGAQRVPTFAGTTVEAEVPKRRTVAALSALGVLVVLGGAALMWMSGSDEPVTEASSDASRPESASEGPAKAVSGVTSPQTTSEATSEVVPEPAAETSSSAPTAAAPPPVPVTKPAAPNPLVLKPQPPKPQPPKPQPPKPQPPKPPGDKYGF